MLAWRWAKILDVQQETRVQRNMQDELHENADGDSTFFAIFEV